MEAEVEPASARVVRAFADLSGAASGAHLERRLTARAPDQPILSIFVLDPDRRPLLWHACLVATRLAPHAPRVLRERCARLEALRRYSPQPPLRAELVQIDDSLLPLLLVRLLGRGPLLCFLLGPPLLLLLAGEKAA